MIKLFQNAKILGKNNTFSIKDILVEDGFISKIESSITPKQDYEIIDINNKLLLPGLIDVHVHLRDPGFTYKETIETGTKAASKGGFTTIFAMSNVNPYPDNVETISEYQQYIKSKSVINCYPYACLTKSQDGYQVCDISKIHKENNISIFTDDGGYGPRNDEVIAKLMQLSNKENVILSFHCEDRNLESKDKCMLTCQHALSLGVKGGMNNEAEIVEVEKYINFAKKYNAHIHICHVSAKRSLQLIEKAKKEGVDVTCEATCHHLTLTCDDVINSNFKMTPPLKTKEDVDYLINGLKNGSIDMIASDHAPHSKQEKDTDLISAAFGISSLETSFPILYTKLVKTNIISLNQLINLMCINPAKRFSLPNQGAISIGNQANFFVPNLEDEYQIDVNNFISKGKNNPYDKVKAFGEIDKTYFKGNLIYQKERR